MVKKCTKIRDARAKLLLLLFFSQYIFCFFDVSVAVVVVVAKALREFMRLPAARAGRSPWFAVG